MSDLTTISSSYIRAGKRSPRRAVSEYPLEIEEQKAAWEYLGYVIVDGDNGRRPLQDYSYMVPNGTQLGGSRVRRAQYMASLKAQGFRPGVSDLVIAHPVGPYHGAYIEMKRVKQAYRTPAALAAAVTPEQKEWLHLMSASGYWTAVAFGVNEFKALVGSYLKGEGHPPLP